MKSTFHSERKAAFDEIQQAFTKQMDVLAQDGVKYADSTKMILPEILEVQEKFRWTPTVLSMAIDLKNDKPLRDIFARVSARYQGGTPRHPAQGLAADLQSTAGQGGRDSAFADIRRALDIAERDFDLTYKPLNREQVQYYLKKHPIGEENIKFAHKENQRHFMKQEIAKVRDILDTLQNPPRSPLSPPPRNAL